MSFVLELYVAGDTALSSIARRNLDILAKQFLCEQDKVMIIDILEHPGLAISRKIIITPTLVKVDPPPAIKIVGDLSDIDSVAQSLGMDKKVRMSS